MFNHPKDPHNFKGTVRLLLFLCFFLFYQAMHTLLPELPNNIVFQLCDTKAPDCLLVLYNYSIPSIVPQVESGRVDSIQTLPLPEIVFERNYKITSSYSYL